MALKQSEINCKLTDPVLRHLKLTNFCYKYQKSRSGNSSFQTRTWSEHQRAGEESKPSKRNKLVQEDSEEWICMWLYLNATQTSTNYCMYAHTCGKRGKKAHKGLICEIGIAHHFLWCSPVQELFSDFDFLLWEDTGNCEDDKSVKKWLTERKGWEIYPIFIISLHYSSRHSPQPDTFQSLNLKTTLLGKARDKCWQYFADCSFKGSNLKKPGECYHNDSWLPSDRLWFKFQLWSTITKRTNLCNQMKGMHVQGKYLFFPSS